MRVWEVVEKFLVVKAVRRSGWGNEDGEGDGRAGKRKRKRKRRQEAERAEDVEDDEDDDELVGNGAPVLSVGASKPSKVLVIQQIESVVSGLMVYIVFSAVGLYFPLFFSNCMS